MDVNNLIDGVFDIPKEIKTLESTFENINSMCLKEIECGVNDIGKNRLAVCLSTKFDDWRLPTTEELYYIFKYRAEILSSIPDIYDENIMDRRTTRVYWCNEIQSDCNSFKLSACGFWNIFVTYDIDTDLSSQKYFLLLVR